MDVFIVLWTNTRLEYLIPPLADQDRKYHVSAVCSIDDLFIVECGVVGCVLLDDERGVAWNATNKK